MFLSINLSISLAPNTIENAFFVIKSKTSGLTSISISLFSRSFKNFLSLSGDENQKRKLFRELLNQETTDNFMNLNKISKMFTSIDFYQMKKVFDKVCSNYDYKINGISYHVLLILVNYCAHPQNKDHAMSSLNTLMKNDLFKRAVKNSNYNGMSMTRKVPLWFLKHKMNRFALLVGQVRQKQFSKSK